ncbi:MAG: hypothetical protein J6R52_03390 [Alphaproteobacteria bacterium]|nr:hypothetical protein [Alphaproteobacteria bacterium]
MKKLTAGIFSVLLGLVSVGSANAAVVSTEYLEDVLETQLANMQTTMTATGPVKIENNVISVDMGAVSEIGTNLVTAKDIYAAVNAAVADQQVKSNLVKTGADGSVVAPAVGTENEHYPSYAATVKIAENAVGILTGGVSALEGDVSTLKTNVADIKENIGNLGEGVTVESALGLKADKTALAATDEKVAANESAIAAINNAETGVLKQAQGYADTKVSELAAGAVKTNADAIAAEKSAREAADAQLQTNINLKANAADVYSKTDADAKFEAQAAATAKLQAAKDYADAQIKTLTDSLGGTGEDGSSTGLTGVVASQGVKISALEDKVGDKSVVARIEELDFSDQAVDKEFVTAVSQENGVITVSRAALAESDIPTLSIEKVEGLQAALDAKQVNLTGQQGVIVIADGVVSIAAGGVGTAQLADAAVTEGKIADNAVTEGKIANNAVTSTKIADGAITKGKIGESAVEAGNLATGAVLEGNIAAGAVTADTIAKNAVGSDQLASDVNSLLAGAIQAPSETNADGTFVLTAKKITVDGKVTYSYAWEDIAGRSE